MHEKILTFPARHECLVTKSLKRRYTTVKRKSNFSIHKIHNKTRVRSLAYFIKHAPGTQQRQVQAEIAFFLYLLTELCHKLLCFFPLLLCSVLLLRWYFFRAVCVKLSKTYAMQNVETTRSTKINNNTEYFINRKTLNAYMHPSTHTHLHQK